jgi:hypothetical protein
MLTSMGRTSIIRTALNSRMESSLEGGLDIGRQDQDVLMTITAPTHAWLAPSQRTHATQRNVTRHHGRARGGHMSHANDCCCETSAVAEPMRSRQNDRPLPWWLGHNSVIWSCFISCSSSSKMIRQGYFCNSLVFSPIGSSATRRYVSRGAPRGSPTPDVPDDPTAGPPSRRRPPPAARARAPRIC